VPQANPGLGDAIPLGLGVLLLRRTRAGRPCYGCAVQANPGLGGAIPLGLGVGCGAAGAQSGLNAGGGYGGSEAWLAGRMAWSETRAGRPCYGGGARAGWTGVESGLLGEGERGKRLKGRERGVGVPWIRGVRGLLWGERVIMEGLPRDRENRAAKINQPARNLT
jgi:hypothetical protein